MRKGFVMQLNAGQEVEYQKRHDAIWPELQSLLKEHGVAHYSIFLDEKTGKLFGYLQLPKADAMDDLPNHPVMQKWWQYMKDIMETNADGSPVSVSLNEVFYMP